jgi:hypothetical protein
VIIKDGGGQNQLGIVPPKVIKVKKPPTPAYEEYISDNISLTHPKKANHQSESIKVIYNSQSYMLTIDNSNINKNKIILTPSKPPINQDTIKQIKLCEIGLIEFRQEGDIDVKANKGYFTIYDKEGVKFL